MATIVEDPGPSLAAPGDCLHPAVFRPATTIVLEKELPVIVETDKARLTKLRVAKNPFIKIAYPNLRRFRHLDVFDAVPCME